MSRRTRFVVQCFTRDDDGSLKQGSRIDALSEIDARQMGERAVPAVTGAVVARLITNWGRVETVDLLARHGEAPDDYTVGVMLLA